MAQARPASSIEGPAKEDTRTTIERCHETRGQSDGSADPVVDEPTPRAPSNLPYEVGCPTFTRELWKVHWPSCKAFKLELWDKYNVNISPSEFLGIYSITVQASRRCDEKVLANYFSLSLKPNMRSWLMNMLEGSISS